MDNHIEPDISAAAFLVVNGCTLESLESIGRWLGAEPVNGQGGETWNCKRK
jgi:hypothetical protein